MSEDETKRLKNEEQSNWEWEFEAENIDVLKVDEKQSEHSFGASREDERYKPYLKVALMVSLVAGLVVLAAGNGFNFGALSFPAIGRFWWMIFVIPMFTRNRNPNWVGLACLFLLFSGALGGMWWLIFLIPMFMGKRSRSC